MKYTEGIFGTPNLIRELLSSITTTTATTTTTSNGRCRDRGPVMYSHTPELSRPEDGD